MGTFIGERLRELRLAIGMSQSELGARVGVTKARVSQWETDREAGIDSMARLEALAAVFQVEVAELLVPARFTPAARVTRRPSAQVIPLPVPAELLGRHPEPGASPPAAAAPVTMPSPLAGLSALQQAAVDALCKACRAGKVSDEQALALLNGWHSLLQPGVARTR